MSDKDTLTLRGIEWLYDPRQLRERWREANRPHPRWVEWPDSLALLERPLSAAEVREIADYMAARENKLQPKMRRRVVGYTHGVKLRFVARSNWLEGFVYGDSPTDARHFARTQNHTDFPDSLLAAVDMLVRSGYDEPVPDGEPND